MGATEQAVEARAASGDAAEGTWFTVAELDDLWEGEMTAVPVGRTSVLLINVAGEVRAYKNRCPHQEWPLDEGDFDGRTLTCGQHMWEFDALSGIGINPDNCSLAGLPCRVDDGDIFVQLP